MALTEQSTELILRKYSIQFTLEKVHCSFVLEALRDLNRNTDMFSKAIYITIYYCKLLFIIKFFQGQRANIETFVLRS